MLTKYTFLFFNVFCIVTCQKQNLRFRIWGGKKIPIEKAPYQASLQSNGKNLCGGTIISNDVILTAGHCVKTIRSFQNRPEKPKVEVRVGSSFKSYGGTVAEIKDMIIHPEYNITSWADNDLGLVVLENPLVYSQSIMHVTLPDQGEDVPDGTKAVVAGWGMTETGYVETLRAVEVSVISPEACRENYHMEITDNMLCAGNPGKDSCVADSGGGLVANGKLIGVVSFGANECGRSDTPGVYANVAALRDWIDDTMRNTILSSKTHVPAVVG